MNCPRCGKTLVFMMSGRIYYGKHHPLGKKERMQIQQYECKECSLDCLYDRETKKWTMGNLYISKTPFQPEWRPKEEWKKVT